MARSCLLVLCLSITNFLPVQALTGDLDCDGKVTFSDFFIFSDNFSLKADAGSDCADLVGDLNCDLSVDFSDFFLFSDNFGKEGELAATCFSEIPATEESDDSPSNDEEIPATEESDDSPSNDEEIAYFNAPQTMADILAATKTVDWTSYTGTFTNLTRLCLGIKDSADIIVIDDSNSVYAADLTVKNDMSASTTHTNDDLLKATFKLLEVGIDTYMMVSAKHSNYAIDYDTIDGVKTLIMKDYRSYYVDSSSAGFLIFTLTTAEQTTYLTASARHAYDSSAAAYIAENYWTPLNVAIDGASAILTTDSGTAFTMFTAYNSVLDQSIPFDFNPTSVARVTNAEAAVTSDGMNKLQDNMRDLLNTYSNQTATPGLDAATTAAADAILAEIVSTLEAEGSALRYPVDFYKVVRENMLSRKVHVSDSYNLTIGSNSVPYVYFTNEADSDGIHHPFMVIGTYAINEGMTHLWDVPRPPGDGITGTYEDQTVTRNVSRSGNLVKIAMKDYGEVDELTDNIMVNDLATDSPQTPEFSHLNYASTSATGIALDGVVVYPTYNNSLNISAAVGEISTIGIHAGRGLAPHYHADAYSATKSGFDLYNDADYSDYSHPPIVTLGFDGVAGYGIYRDGDTTSDGVDQVLDDWGGHDHGVYAYHYHSQTMDATYKDISFTAHMLPPKGAWRGRINEIPNFWDNDKPAYGGQPDKYHGVEVR